MKIFTDTEKYKDRWYRNLHPYTKLIWDYAWHNCDCAGVWSANTEEAEDRIGFKRIAPDFKVGWLDRFNNELNMAPPDADGKTKPLDIPQVHKLEDGQWWLVRKVEFQYGVPFKVRTDGVLVPMYVPIARRLHEVGVLGLFEQYYPGSVPDIAKDGLPNYRNPSLPAAPRKNTEPSPTFDQVREWLGAGRIPDSEVRLFIAHYDACGWKRIGVQEDPQHLAKLWVAQYDCDHYSTDMLVERFNCLTSDILQWSKATEKKPGTSFSVLTAEAREQIRRLNELKAIYENEITTRKDNHQN